MRNGVAIQTSNYDWDNAQNKIQVVFAVLVVPQTLR